MSNNKRTSQRRIRPFITTFLVVVSLVMVKGNGTNSVSNTFVLNDGAFSLVSHPLCSSLGTAAALEAEIRTQFGNPSVNLDVARLIPGLSPTFECYPVGSTIISDFDPSLNCTTRTNNLNIGSLEGILIRVRGGSGSLTWSGTENSFPSYFIAGTDIAQWLSLPFLPAPYTADELVTAVLGGSGRVTRFIPGTSPVFEFWSVNPNSFPPKFGINFTLSAGEGVQVRGASGGISGCVTGGIVQGTVFNDDDPPNGQLDPGESGLQGRPLKLVHAGSGTTTSLAWTTLGGGYSFSCVPAPDNYEVDLVDRHPGEPWLPVGPIPVTVVNPTDVLTDNDFGRKFVKDLQVAIYRTVPFPLRAPCSTAVPPGNQMTYCVKYRNVGSFNQNQTRVTLDLPASPSQVTILSNSVQNCSPTAPLPPPPTVVGTSVTWKATNSPSSPFKPADECTACVTVEVRPPLGDTLIATANVFLNPGNQDLIPATANTATRFDTDRCAIDPNDKQVEPQGCGPEGFLNRGETFTYLVRFQNDGNAPAQRVVVIDLLDIGLDESTLEVVDTSHLLTDLELRPDRSFVFTFDGINLPSSGVDPEGSQGFVLFSVQPRPGQPSGTRIPNVASIVFDLNAPIVTNAVLNRITDNSLPADGSPSAEVCDGVDNDCDGEVDEEPEASASCDDGDACTTDTCAEAVCTQSVLVTGIQPFCTAAPQTLNRASQGNSFTVDTLLLNTCDGLPLDPLALSPAYISKVASPSIGTVILPTPSTDAGCDNFTEDGLWETLADRQVQADGSMKIKFRLASDGECTTLDGNRQDIIALLLDVPDGEMADVCITGGFPGAGNVECCAPVQVFSKGIR